jgi:hypothetical protein
MWSLRSGEIWGSHVGDRKLVCSGIKRGVFERQTFRKTQLPPSSGSKNLLHSIRSNRHTYRVSYATSLTSMWYCGWVQGEVRQSLGTHAAIGPAVPPTDDERYLTFDGMRIGRGNRSTRRKGPPQAYCSLQTPHKLTGDWTWVAAVRSRRLTTWPVIPPQRTL